MTKKELKLLTNAELNLRLKSLENRYTMEQKRALEIIEKMALLDQEYNMVKMELSNRTGL